jgi:hypothetical protein
MASEISARHDRAMRLAAILLLAATAIGHAGPAQPRLLGEVKGRRARIVVRGDVPSARHRELVSLVTSIVADVERRFVARHDADAPVTLLLFAEGAQYREHALALREPLVSELGFYLPERRVAIANVGNSVGNLRHELVHPLLGDDFPTIPAWLNEGIASLYGSAKVDKRGVRFLVNYRLRDLQRALKAGTLPTLAELATSSPEVMYGKRANVFYALARYVLLYLDRQGKLGEVYAELRAAKPADQAQILASHVDEPRFRAWARKLRL